MSSTFAGSSTHTVPSLLPPLLLAKARRRGMFRCSSRHGPLLRRNDRGNICQAKANLAGVCRAVPRPSGLSHFPPKSQTALDADTSQSRLGCRAELRPVDGHRDQVLQLRDVRSLRTFGALGDFEFNLLAFPEGLKPLTFDSRVMDKHILRAILRGDKTIPLLVAEPLDGSFRHS